MLQDMHTERQHRYNNIVLLIGFSYNEFNDIGVHIA